MIRRPSLRALAQKALKAVLGDPPPAPERGQGGLDERRLPHIRSRPAEQQRRHLLLYWHDWLEQRPFGKCTGGRQGKLETYIASANTTL